MNKLIYLFIFSVSIAFLRAEEKENITYKLLKKGSVETLKPYLKAVETANWKCYRMLNKSRIIIFDTGVEIELFSALSISSKGINISKDCLVSEETVNLIQNPPIYRLDPSGRILEIHDAPKTKPTLKDKLSK